MVRETYHLIDINSAEKDRESLFLAAFTQQEHDPSEGFAQVAVLQRDYLLVHDSLLKQIISKRALLLL